MTSVSRLFFPLAIALMAGAVLSPAKADEYPRQFSIEARMIMATHRLNTAGPMMMAEAEDMTVNFNTGSSKLTAEGARQVKAIAAELKEHKSRHCHFMVQGYTDSVGNEAANQRLSYHRALTVMHVLVRQYGIPARMLTAQGYGSADPVATNETAEGRAENRRVTVVRTDADRS